MQHESDYEQMLHEEIEKRLGKMEKPDYQFPQRFSKKDYFIVVAVSVFCLVMLIIGANV